MFDIKICDGANCLLHCLLIHHIKICDGANCLSLHLLHLNELCLTYIFAMVKKTILTFGLEESHQQAVDT